MRRGLGAAVALVLAAGLVAAATQGERADELADPTVGPAEATTTAPPLPAESTTTTRPFAPIDDPNPVALVWAPGGIDGGLAAAATERAEGAITATTTVDGGRAMFVETRDRTGAVVDRAADGLAIPLDVIAVDPATHQRFLPVDAQELLHGLGDSEVILGASSASIRRLGPGGTIVLSGGSGLTVIGTLPDTQVNGAEALVSQRTGATMGLTPRFVLAKHADDLSAVQQAFRASQPPEEPVRVRDTAEVRFARHGDGVLTQVEIKRWFGEFGFVEGDGVREFAQRDEAWIDANVGSTDLPIIGRTECHRELLGSLGRALADVDRLQEQLRAEYRSTTTTTTTTSTTSTTSPPASTSSTTAPPPEADPNYPVLLEADASLGCFNPRQIGQGGPDAGISRHAWGAAIDLRPPRGATRHDPRVVEIFARWGFVNGQDWLTPDAPHFEWNVPPD